MTLPIQSSQVSLLSFVHTSTQTPFSDWPQFSKSALVTLSVAEILYVCRRYNAQSDWLIVTELQGTILS